MSMEMQSVDFLVMMISLKIFGKLLKPAAGSEHHDMNRIIEWTAYLLNPYAVILNSPISKQIFQIYYAVGTRGGNF